LSITQKQYQLVIESLKWHIVREFLLYSLILALISLLFAYYAIRPLRKALELNDEFVRDMLHDFNTPISSLKINFKILEKKFGQDSAIVRSHQAMQRIANLQSNLSYFLSHSVLEKELIDVAETVALRVHSHQVVFSDIDFQMDISSYKIEVNREAFIRVLDNLLSNAGKYNKPKGSIHLYMQEESLVIEDTGIGIKEPQKIFERFYKETDRGMGIGLHIVKKLCQEMNIGIVVESNIKKGTKFFLRLKEVRANH
jgi:signal transduction histidine kinase